MQKIKPETITAIASVTIALAAIFISIWQGIETRKHNRLSVTPSAGFSFDMRSTNKTIGLFIRNDGLGPAIIKEIIVSLGDAQYDGNSVEGWLDVMSQLNINQPWIQYFAPNKDSYLRPGQQLKLLTANADNINTEQRNMLRRAISQLKIRVEYESVYGQEFDAFR